MFTGLVETVGVVRSIDRHGEVTNIEIEAPDIAPKLSLNESISVSGACLSVVKAGMTSFTAEMMEETATVTKLGMLKPFDRVNLERALKAGDRLGGHIVLGHVEGIGTVSEISRKTQTCVIRIQADVSILRYVVPKGSIAIDGVSLTVISVTDTDFTVGVIPSTLRLTTLGNLKVKDPVNLETDIIGKYIERFLKASSRGKADEQEELTWERLAEYGWQ
ncbi:MAG TPA: riboflavin synthase [Acetomicrobium flavidum]|nr:riboflavin synthase [Acetomicrobium flavidum]HPP14071.1 riboflavin synthase [Acetomicrobium flavidum]